MARQIGCEVPEWRDDYLLDYHALAAIQEAAEPILPIDAEDD